jgi:hypothetical protein
MLNAKKLKSLMFNVKKKQRNLPVLETLNVEP